MIKISTCRNSNTPRHPRKKCMNMLVLFNGLIGLINQC